MAAYYNEIDKGAAAWLRELIAMNLIADGDVDERSIADVEPKDLKGYTQCHFFAGIGVWSHALRLAGIRDDAPVWTGSCPCQPFSSAGKRGGVNDERHLWPEMFRLIAECRPPVVFGEQVAGKAGAGWVDIVRSELAGEGYASGMAVFPACSIGAPHQRQRLYWVAESSMADTNNEGSQGRSVGRDGTRKRTIGSSGVELQERPGPTNGFWGAADWLFCRDGKWRPAKPGSFPLVARSASGVGHSSDPGISEVEATSEARVMRLKGYGNAIVGPQAQAFIEAYFEARKG